MTLSKEQRAAYGPDWPAVSLEVRERSGGRCECEGECGWNRHRAGRCPATNGKPSPFTSSRVVLTAAHLDRDGHTGVHDLTRIKAFCQGCHLAYDRQPQNQCRHGELEGQCASCAACNACDGSCGYCLYAVGEIK